MPCHLSDRLMQFRRVPHAATPTGQQGNAGAGNDNSDAENPQCHCDADQELRMSKRKGSLVDAGANQVTPPKPPNKT